MTTTSSSGTILTESNGSSGDVGSNEPLVIQTDPSNDIVTSNPSNSKDGIINHHQKPINEDEIIIISEPSSPQHDSNPESPSGRTELTHVDTSDNKNDKPLSSTSSSRDDVKEIDPRDRRLVYVSSLQLILGGLVLIWGGSVISNEAALGGASAAASLIGGVASTIAGISGFMARYRKNLNKSAHSSATTTVAMSAVGIAACSLVIALSATGLLRDGSRPSEQVSWGALLCNTGLLLTSSILTATCVVAAIHWRRDAGICTSRRSNLKLPATPEPLPGTPPAPHKHKLVSKWLGQQQGGGPALFMISPMLAPPSGRGGSVYSAASAPHIIPLHMPPPAMAIPPYMLPPMGPPMPCMLHGSAMTLPTNRKERRRSRHKRHSSSVGHSATLPPAALMESRDPEEMERIAAAAAKRQRVPPVLTEEEVDRSYTGLDRTIAEDFITNTLEKHQHPQNGNASRRTSASTAPEQFSERL